MTLAAWAVAGALALDLLVGEPPDGLHPVAWFGRATARLDRNWQRPRLAGVAVALVAPAVVATSVGSAVAIISVAEPLLALAAGTLVLFLTTSYRSLLLTVRRVGVLAERDLDASRRELRALAGRDATTLEAGLIRSAALESLAENLADGLVAVLLAFGFGGLLGGLLGLSPGLTIGLACGGAVWIKAVNTLDSMWGYPDRPLGTGAARLDDLAMWVPARVTAVLIAIAFLAPGAIRRARTWRGVVSSPNAGWPMGVFAAALDVRLEKPGHYSLNPDAPLPAAADLAVGLRRVGLAGFLAYGLVGVLAWS